MIRSTKVLFCGEEHGFGNVSFPRIDQLDERDFISPRTIAQLRKDAKAAGWSRHNGEDYCDLCTEGMREQKEAEGL